MREVKSKYQNTQIMVRKVSVRAVNKWVRENPSWDPFLKLLRIDERLILISYAICDCNATKAAAYTGLNYQTFVGRLKKIKAKAKQI